MADGARILHHQDALMDTARTGDDGQANCADALVIINNQQKPYLAGKALSRYTDYTYMFIYEYNIYVEYGKGNDMLYGYIHIFNHG